MAGTFQRSIVWLRRDLRLRDNAALARACSASAQIVPVFVVDPQILRSERTGAPIVQCFFDAVAALRADLRERASDLAVLCGEPARELVRFARRIDAQAVFYNEDYEPAAIRRDDAVTRALEKERIDVQAALDHVYFGAHEIERDDGCPYKVYTPYRKRWETAAWQKPRGPLDSLRALAGKLVPREQIGQTQADPQPEDFGFARSAEYPQCSEAFALKTLERFTRSAGLERYGKDRDYPALDGTSKLSPHLRAGTIGIRTCFQAARDAQSWSAELIWREFYQMILKRFPYVADGPFLPWGKKIAWRGSDRDFNAWCNGETGYPIVDAAMRQLNRTGWMHNRLRMIVASFLCKDLLVDWRRGERYFEQHLADADLAQNNGGWQWSASTGTDAVPYFRIFNPVTQSKRFDPRGDFIRAMLPELKDVPERSIHAPWTMPSPPRDYPAPIVEHGFARERAIAVYRAAQKR